MRQSKMQDAPKNVCMMFIVAKLLVGLSLLSNMSSFFHYSAIRTLELKKIASEHNLHLLNMPKIFEIRWSQFTFSLVRSFLVSWNALVIYFKTNEKDAVCAGYHNYLTKLENVELIAFLADVLYAFGRFQKKLQSDQLTLISMKAHTNAIIRTLSGMENVQLLGGFESNLATQLSTGANGGTYLKSIELQPRTTSRVRRKAKSFADVRKSILDALCNFLVERFEIDELLFEKIEPLINFSKDANIKEIHSMLAPDLSLLDLNVQFEEISNDPKIIKDNSLNEIILKLSNTTESRDSYKELITVLARIAACTPHSADVERCISANNLLKTKLRSSISIETENKYMYIHANMPDLAQWNPTAAAKLFVEEKVRRHRDATPANETTRQRDHYKGVFPEARQMLTDDDKDDDDDVDGGCERGNIFNF